MMEPERGSVMYWLARVPESDSLHSPNYNPKALFSPSRSFKLPDVLEISDALPDFRRHSKILPKEDLTGQPPEQCVKRKADSQYERKPRHKTKKDRYEYKAPGLEKENSRNKKAGTKRARQMRKKTLNDVFHASNVPRSRLTLQSNANRGIFNKGKSSSPVKTRDNNISPAENRRLFKTANFAFSEKEFLLHKRPRSAGSPSATGTKRNQQGRYMRQQNLLNYSRFAPTLSNKSATSPVASLKKAQHVPLSIIDPSQNIQMKKQNEHYPDIIPDQCSHQLLLVAPSSWSGLEPDKTDLGCAIEIHLLNHLHVGLSRQPSCQNQIENMKSYCDLQDLKILLENRRAYWGAGTEETPKIARSSSLATSLNKPTLQSVLSSNCPVGPSLVPCSIPGEPPTDSEFTQYPIGKAYSPIQDDALKELQSVQALSMRDVNLEHESCLETLDERFWEIFNTNGQGYEAIRDNTELHSLQPWLCLEEEGDSVSILREDQNAAQ